MQVVSEWGCKLNDVDIPMLDMCGDNKRSQMTDDKTFLGLDSNRLIRWDRRMAEGVAQVLASPTLGRVVGRVQVL
jgi:aryl carrier-like protein